MRHKFYPLKEILEQNVLDILFIQETKLDVTFPDGQFHVKDFRNYRKDHTGRSGGLMTFIMDDIVQKRRVDLEIDCIENGRIETMAIEMMIRKERPLGQRKTPPANKHLFVTYR